MDLITVITYICAGLGGVLLLLCIILAAFLIVAYCKKYLGLGSAQYVIVQTVDGASLENGTPSSSIVLRKFSRDDLARDKVDVGGVVVNETKSKVPPVKKKMLWRKNKKKSIDIMPPNGNNCDTGVQFSAEDLDVPKEGSSYKKQFKSRRRSKSDWNIYNIEEEHLLIGQPNQTAPDPIFDKQSQYFDALDTIEEETTDDDDQDDLDEAATLVDQWEDISDSYEELVDKNSYKHHKKHNVNKKYSQSVKQRINSLKVLQLKQKHIEAQFYIDLFELEAKCTNKLKEPLYEERRRIVNCEDAFGDTGIDGFWLKAMDNCESLKPIVQIHDRPILEQLQDIRIVSSPVVNEKHVKTASENMGFRLEFHFAPNDYFDDVVLTKDYALRCEVDETDPWIFDGPEVVNCRGCKIHWNRGKNATLRPVRKLKNGEIVTKWAKRNSFFNFFTPPKLTRDTLLDAKKTNLMEAHYEIGLYLKETFIPQAIVFYANAKTSTKSDSAVKHRHHHKAGTSRKMPVTKPVILHHITHHLPIPGDPFSDEASSRLSEQAEHTEDAKAKQKFKADANANTEEDTKSAIVEVFPPPSADPISGRYRLLSTENFDEFMKRLGVGLVRRKLANSISPVNVIIVNEDGSYTVRTETSVRTTELNFQLGIPFDEPTLDGRVTKTTASRLGNVLTLDQKGDPAKHEKDSKMIRDFQGDSMYMSLIVEDVVCKRVYQRISED